MGTHVSGTGNDFFVCSSGCSRITSARSDHACAMGKMGPPCAGEGGLGARGNPREF